jgi:hypothetical protein
MRRSTVLLIALALVAHGARAQPRRSLSGPFLVRIEGVLGAKPPGPLPLASWQVARGRELYDLHVSKLQVLSGNIAYFNIVSRLDPYRPAFSIAGDDKAIQAFVSAPTGQPLVIMGYLRIDPAARVLMLSSVEAVTATPVPTVR